MAGKSIVGEIGSDGCIKHSITFPVLQNMLIKTYAEMNHFLTNERLQRGEFPHRYGITLNVHI